MNQRIEHTAAGKVTVKNLATPRDDVGRAPAVEHAVRLGDEERQPADQRIVAAVRDPRVGEVAAGPLVEPDQLVEFVGGRASRTRRALPVSDLEPVPRVLVGGDERIDVHVAIYATSCMDLASVQTARPDGNDGIVTPEAVVLELETAGFGSRVFGALVDLAAMTGIFFVVMVVVGLTFANTDELDGDDDRRDLVLRRALRLPDRVRDVDAGSHAWEGGAAVCGR